MILAEVDNDDDEGQQNTRLLYRDIVERVCIIGIWRLGRIFFSTTWLGGDEDRRHRHDSTGRTLGFLDAESQQ